LPKTPDHFTTAHKKFASEGFELDALDYLLKPIDFTRFSKAVQKAIEYLKYKTHQRMKIKPISLFILNIDWLKLHSRYSSISKAWKIILKFICYRQAHSIADAPQESTGKLPPEQFSRIHRSYIVSIDK
jgi:DNA-binding LytR/AlgR family response regulator